MSVVLLLWLELDDVTSRTVLLSSGSAGFSGDVQPTQVTQVDVGEEDVGDEGKTVALLFIGVLGLLCAS